MHNQKFKVGILGGGQLGRMLLQAAANYTVETHVLENTENCSAAHLCHYFVKGNITDFETVYSFGKNLDAITVEIENVNIEALEKLESEGVKVYPSPAALKTIKNKILQKEFYAQHKIPTAPFVVTQNTEELKQYIHFLPAVHKIGEGGYDGKGVVILNDESSINNGFDVPSVLEKKIAVKNEIAIIVAVDNNGLLAIYPATEMVFDPILNLLDYQVAPAILHTEIIWKVEAIAITVAKALKSPGVFAIEFLIDGNDEVWVNETAPRVHNSGHHTIEANYCSQFDMLWRIILNYPLGNTNTIKPSALVNLVGQENCTGTPIYKGIENVLQMDTAFVHLYGKQETKPGRKMGHVTVLGDNTTDLMHKANIIKSTLKVKA